ncbi:hypothetical protein AXG93_3873s1060 [Marchantia polymorpha subsp. ruderalis]|uniref:Uncharacterized protein n=1 Tax=Marchantia polymorpha subsp. ruderalis TaxID=1480154 RepID=A0A176VHX7_MARPO|nr:hypothetical protein AXG93_3873s1060 [Marchantia polymorpha subsp. ruderalis]
MDIELEKTDLSHETEEINDLDSNGTSQSCTPSPSFSTDPHAAVNDKATMKLQTSSSKSLPPLLAAFNLIPPTPREREREREGEAGRFNRPYETEMERERKQTRRAGALPNSRPPQARDPEAGKRSEAHWAVEGNAIVPIRRDERFLNPSTSRSENLVTLRSDIHLPHVADGPSL